MADGPNRAERRRRKKQARAARAPAAPPTGKAAQDALALHRAGHLADAETAYRRALSEDGDDLGLLANLAGVQAGLGKGEAAIATIRRALTVEPAFVEGHYNLGVLSQGMGRLDDAADAYADAIRLDPEYVAARVNLGVVRQAQNRLIEALAAYRDALALDDAIPEVHLNLGLVLKAGGDADAAVHHLRRAVEIRPDYVDALNALGVALAAAGEAEQGIETLERALALKPNFAEALNNLGTLLQKRGRVADAEARFRAAVAARPEYAEAHRNLAHALFLAGRHAEAWPEFEWRWKCPDFPSEHRPFAQAPWRGEDVAGKKILVWGEQGAGDEVLFAGMVPGLVERGADVVLECDERLVPLYRRSFRGVACVARATPPAPETQATDIAFQVPAGGLGRWLRPDMGAFPARESYLIADRGRRAELREKYLAGDDVRLVGIAWISKNPEVGSEKSMALSDWGPIAAVPGVRLVDLQYGDTAAERAAFEVETSSAVVHDETVDQMADLDAFAAQIVAMDLVISVSNTTVHMAGALGVPTWIMLNTVPLSCWMMAGERSPWYPSVRLYRQTSAGKWSEVIAAVARDLARLDNGGNGG